MVTKAPLEANVPAALGVVALRARVVPGRQRPGLASGLPFRRVECHTMQANFGLGYIVRLLWCADRNGVVHRGVEGRHPERGIWPREWFLSVDDLLTLAVHRHDGRPVLWPHCAAQLDK